MGDSVCVFVIQLLSDGDNSTSITLIPKVDDPSYVQELDALHVT